MWASCASFCTSGAGKALLAEAIVLVRCRHRWDVDTKKLERKLKVLRKREAVEQYIPGEGSRGGLIPGLMCVALRNQWKRSLHIDAQTRGCCARTSRVLMFEVQTVCPVLYYASIWHHSIAATCFKHAASRTGLLPGNGRCCRVCQSPRAAGRKS